VDQREGGPKEEEIDSQQDVKERRCPLKSLRMYPDIESQKQRFINLNWTKVECYDMFFLHENFIDAEQRRKAQRIQMLDELEEWRMIQEHHCIVWAHFFKPDSPLSFANMSFVCS